jgi:hypothetical protein
MSEDFKFKLGDFLNPSGGDYGGRYREVRYSNKTFFYVDNVKKNYENILDSLGLIMDNSNYSPEYLKRLYVVEFYQILYKIEEKIRRKLKGK